MGYCLFLFFLLYLRFLILNIFLDAVMHANDPVDLFILPGRFFFSPIFFAISLHFLFAFFNILLTMLLGLAFDRSGRRLGHGGE